MKYLITVFLILSPTLIFAQNVTVVDNSTIAVISNQSIVDIENQIKAYEVEQSRYDSYYQGLIAPLQAKIDAAAIQGASDALPLASSTAQATIAAKAVVSQPLDVQGTVSL